MWKNTSVFKGNWERLAQWVVIVIKIKIGSFPVQTPPGAQPGLGTQHCCETPSDLPIEIVKTQGLTSD